MLIVTTNLIPGKNLEPLGIVKGSTIQTVNVVRDIGAGLAVGDEGDVLILFTGLPPDADHAEFVDIRRRGESGFGAGTSSSLSPHQRTPQSSSRK